MVNVVKNFNLVKEEISNFKNANIFNTYITSGHSSVVERLVANEKVVGSNPIARSKNINTIKNTIK